MNGLVQKCSVKRQKHHIVLLLVMMNRKLLVAIKIHMDVSDQQDLVGLSHNKHVSEYGKIQEQLLWKSLMILHLIKV